MTHKYVRPLTEGELAEVLVTVVNSTPDLALPGCLFQVMGLLNPDLDKEATIRPQEYGIPKSQWIILAEAVQAKLGVQGALDFMNLGPSGVDVPPPVLPPLEGEPSPEPEPEATEPEAVVTAEEEVQEEEAAPEAEVPAPRASRSRAKAIA